MNFNSKMKSKLAKVQQQKYEPKLMAIHHHRSGSESSVDWMDARNLFILFRINALALALCPLLVSISVSHSFPFEHRHRVRRLVRITLCSAWYTCSQINRWRNGSHHHSLCYWHFTNIFIQHPTLWNCNVTGFGNGTFGNQHTHTQTHSHIMKSKSIKFFSSTVFEVCVHTFHFGSRSHIFLASAKPTVHRNQHQTYKTIKPSI